MDNFAYLNQISQSVYTKPAKPKSQSSIFGISLGKLIIGGIVIFFALIAFGSLLSSINNKPKELAKQLYTRSTNLNSTVSDFTPYVKSSRLRSIGVSLSTVLTHTTKQLSAYISGEDRNEKDLELSKKAAEEETQIAEELNISLTNAKLNGILDRAYENQITLQVSLLLSQTSQLLARSKDSELTSILTTFQSSLSSIHSSLETYSSVSN